jgi:hypothetical protein
MVIAQGNKKAYQPLTSLPKLLMGCKLFLNIFVYLIRFMNSIDPQVKDFILFCARRSGKSWPAIYDEMVLVAGQRLYKDMSYSELKQLGLSLRINGLDETIRLVRQAVVEDQ